MAATADTRPDGSSHQRLDVAVIGAGFGGIGMAIALLAAGRRDFAVFERADELGGTWRDNRYPGCACDVPSHLYSYSFAPKPDWSSRYAGWAEILAYLHEVAARHGVLPYLRCGRGVTQLDHDASSGRWRIGLSGGSTVDARVVISAVGGFSTPRAPSIQGHEDFVGVQCHTARWDAGHAFEGRRVDRRLDHSVWTRCSSWYRGRGGRVSAIWPDFTLRYRALTRRPDPRALILARAPAPTQAE